jgi:hypothetical protein
MTATVEKTTVPRRYRAWCPTHSDGWNGTKPTAEKWAREHNAAHHPEGPLCPSTIHPQPVPGTIPGTWNNPHNEDAPERVHYCPPCAEMGAGLGMFTPDAEPQP